MRPAKELFGYVLGILCIYGLADNLALEIHNGIGTDDQRVRIFFSDIFRLGQS